MIETFASGLPIGIHRAAESVMKEICERELKIACAESCTGGLLAAVLTDVEGCAHGFERGVVAYTDDAKTEFLGVPPDIIQSAGAVSEVVAKAMADGMLGCSDADFAVSTTGFAGPGGPDDHPGLVYVGFARKGVETKAFKHEYGRVSRAAVRIASLEDAFRVITRALQAP